MKVKIIAKDENYTIYKDMLEKGGFIIDDKAELVLKEDLHQDVFLGMSNGDIIPIPYNEVLYIESYGRDVYINTMNGFFKLKNRLYEVDESLKNSGFLRISKSVIINKAGIESIKPIINSRFELIMKNKEKVTVTKSYRKIFRTFIGF